jgi:hypothetical protein
MSEQPLRILSLGAGVQSSALALMVACGEVAPMLDAAIFADTQAEPAKVYRWLDWLEKRLPFPVYRVTAGNLETDFLKALGNKGERCAQPPFYVRNPASGDAGGMLWRQCTQDYKLRPIRRKTRELCKAAGVKTAEQWIGISLDEHYRMKPSGVMSITNIFPLVDRRISRYACLEWMKKHGYPEPPKSACYFCPYINNQRWKDIKQHEPVDFERACTFDEKLRESRAKSVGGVGITGELFVHRSFKPLRLTVLTNVEAGEMDLFNNECEGMCGV